MDTDVSPVDSQIQPDPVAAQAQEPLAAEALDSLVDPLAETGDEGDSVQMIVPPKPGAGPRVHDRFLTVEQILAAEEPA